MPNNTSKPPKAGDNTPLADALARKRSRGAPGPRHAELRKGPPVRPQRRGGRPKLFPGRTGGR